MKKRIGIVALILSLLFVAYFGYGWYKKNMEKEEMPGGVQNNTDANAPKVIVSKEITEFLYEYNTGSLSPNAHYAPPYVYYIFSVQGREGILFCNVKGHGGNTFAADWTFTVSADALVKLQQIIDKYELAKFNGIDRHVNGLAPYLGSKLWVEYASGERLYAGDNAAMVINQEASLALYHYFTSLAQEAGYRWESESGTK